MSSESQQDYSIVSTPEGCEVQLTAAPAPHQVRGGYRSVAGASRAADDLDRSPLGEALRSGRPVGYVTAPRSTAETVDYLAAVETIRKQMGDHLVIVDDLGLSRCRFPRLVRGLITHRYMTELYILGDESGEVDWPVMHAWGAAVRHGRRVLYVGPGPIQPYGPMSPERASRWLLRSGVALDENLSQAFRRDASLSLVTTRAGVYRRPIVSRRLP